MCWNWNYLVIGTIIVAGGAACAYYRQKKNAVQSFPDYCSECIKSANFEFVETDNLVRTILVLAKVDDKSVAPFFYRSFKDGTIRKKRINYRTYPFCMCPKDVQDSISKGECIIKRY